MLIKGHSDSVVHGESIKTLKQYPRNSSVHQQSQCEIEPNFRIFTQVFTNKHILQISLLQLMVQ